MTLKQAHKECKAIWKWLSKNSDPCKDDIDNKNEAMNTLGINGEEYRSLCPYCEYIGRVPDYINTIVCSECPIVIKYGTICQDIGYQEYDGKCSKENAKKFYDKIKDL
jgi:hypothetical protein